MLKKLISLCVTALAAAGMIFGASYLPTNGWIVGSAASFSPAQVKAKDLTLVCPGSVFATGGKSGTNVNAFTRIGSAVVDYSSNLPTGVVLKAQPLTGPVAGRSTLGDTGNQLANLAAQSALGITVKDQLGKAPQSSTIFTAQSYQVAASDGINGTIGANCQLPATESWLLGGVTTVGREALLILSNPAATDATVDLQQDLAAAALGVLGQQVQDGHGRDALARAGLAHQGQAFAGRDRQVHAVHDFGAVKRDAQVTNVQQGFH